MATGPGEEETLCRKFTPYWAPTCLRTNGVLIHIVRSPGSTQRVTPGFSAFPFHRNNVGIFERSGNFFTYILITLYLPRIHIRSLHVQESKCCVLEISYKFELGNGAANCWISPKCQPPRAGVEVKHKEQVKNYQYSNKIVN